MGRLRTCVAAVAVLLAMVTGCGRSGSDSPEAAAPPPSVWPLPDDPRAAAQKAGLAMLDREMLAVHYHAHLDVLIASRAVTVPAGLGIDRVRHRISPLHTHDASGVIHIESRRDIPFTLGQLFTEWGQPLSARQVGPYRLAPGEMLRVFRNGRPVLGDPAALQFAAHDEDVVWVGPASAHPTVASTYPFPQGL
jgi:hypothetical protein